MKLVLQSFDSLEALTEYVNENQLKPGAIELTIREGAGYKMLFWSKRVKTDNANTKKGGSEPK